MVMLKVFSIHLFTFKTQISGFVRWKKEIEEQCRTKKNV